jgi:predicted phosphodiesterase
MENINNKLIRLEPKGTFVFVGDTHGDIDASQTVLTNYLKSDHTIIFLGDYVDRGDYSKENINFLLETRKNNPEQVYLLLGNHDAYGIQRCYPCNFWDSLSSMEKETFFKIFEEFPLAVSVGNVLSLHGALPNVKKLEDINNIKNNDENWHQILWGDFQDITGKELGYYHGRPQFGKDYFFEVMKRLNKKVLIRAHQQRAPEKMFDNRCLTIFTSSAYPRDRTVAILNSKKDIKTIDDIIIKRI